MPDVCYVVSIADTLLYFDADRRPADPLPSGGDTGTKPDLHLIPPDRRPAAAQEWDEALNEYSDEQRGAAEVSEVR